MVNPHQPILMKKPETPAVASGSGHLAGRLQCCSCKKSAGPGGEECPECKKKRESGPVLQRKTAAASAHSLFSAEAPPAGRTPRFDYNFSRVPVHAGSQASRLSIGAPGDRYEQEAERVAEQVVQLPEPMAGAHSVAPFPIGAGDGATKRIQRDMRSPYSPDEGSNQANQSQNQDQDQGTVQTQAQPGRTPQLSREFENQIGSLQGGGRPLAAPVRASMESRFGHDFSRVRIHTGPAAAAMAASIQARAFTLGPDVVFGTGEYSPESESGRRLLAHELTHSIQQGHAPPSNLRQISNPDAGAKMEGRSASVAPPSPIRAISAEPAVARTVRCVRWNPNVDTGRKVKPWGTGPDGRILTASTDAGTSLNIWKPDDGQSYWCHGFTFGGNTAVGGPYSFWGQDVPTVLNDEGWGPQDSCAAKPGDILVFSGGNPITHSGIVRNAVNSGGGVDEDASKLDSKWGSGAQNTSSWSANTAYGQYRCYSKNPTFGSCKYRGVNENGSTLPLPPGDYPQPSQSNSAVV